MGDGSPLPAWLSFDETTLRLSGEVPALYFDAPDVRITLTERDTTTGEISSRPLTLKLPLEYDVDFRGIGGFRAVAEGDDYRLELPEDWSGSFAMRYLAEDQKEAVSANWGLTVFNVVEQREVPVAQDDTLIGREDEALSFTLADLIANDSDGDGDPVRITSFVDDLAVNTPTPVYESATQILDETTRPGLVEAYVTYSATLSDGSALPEWLSVTDGTLTGQPPIGHAGSLALTVTADDGLNPPVETAVTFTATPQGTLVAHDPVAITQDAPASASDGMTDPTFGATLLDGSPLPAWLSLDAMSGRLSGTPPLGLATPLMVLLSATQGSAMIQTEVGVDPSAAYGYTFTPSLDYTGDVEFSYTITDDLDGEDSAGVTLTIRPRDVAPDARDDGGFTTDEDVALLIPFADLLANDEDWDGDAIRISSVEAGTGGTVELTATGVLFTPTPDTEGTATFSYTLTDDLHGTDTAEVSVEVLSTNRAPVALEDRFAGTEDTVLYLDAAQLIGNDTDADGDPLTLASVVQEVSGGRALILPEGRMALTPGADLTGEITFEYTISDGRLESEETGRIVVDFAPVNDAPRAGTDSGFETAEDAAIAIDAASLIANDVDVEGDSFELVGVLDPINGSVAFSGGQVIFTPRADYFGNAGFSYVIEDVHGAQGIGEVTLSVLPDADFPIAVSDLGYRIGEGETLLLDPSVLLANDVDPDGGALTFDGIASALGGNATMTPEGLIEFAGAADFSGRAVVSYRVVNEDGLSATGRVEIDVVSGQDSPIARGETLATDEDVALVVPELALLANDTDPDDHSFVLTGVSDAVGGTVARDGLGNVVFTPAADWNGPGGFAYTITDVTGLTDQASVVVNVAPVDDAPRAIGDVGPFDGVEDTPVDIDVSTLFTDPEGDEITLALTGPGGDPAPAWLTLTNGRITGTPPADLNGAVEIALTATANGLATTVETQILLAPVEDAPVLSGDLGPFNSPEDAPFSADLSGYFTDADGDAVTLTVTGPEGSDLPAWLSFDGAMLQGQPPADFNGILAVDVTATSTGGTLTQTALLTIDPVDDAPRLTLPLPELEGEAGDLFTLDMAPHFADPEGDAISFTATGPDGAALPEWLSLSGSVLSGTPPNTFGGTLSLNLTATANGLSLSVPTTLEVTISNLPPEANDDTLAGVEDVALSVALSDLTANDTDPNDDPLNVVEVGGATHGSVELDGAGNAVFTPDADFNGEARFTYRVSDGVADATATVTINFAAQNDAPIVVAMQPDLSLDEDSADTFILAPDLFSDVDGDALSLSIRAADGGAAPAWILFNPEARTIQATPPANFNGTLDLTLSATDGTLSAEQPFALTVTPVNDAPVVTTPLADRLANEGEAFDIAMMQGTVTDPDGDALEVTLTLADGSDLPAWMSFDAESFALRGTAPEGTFGVFDLQATWRDPSGAEARDFFALEVIELPDPPVFAIQPEDVFLPEDTLIDLALPAGMVTDENAGDTLSITARLSDGSALPDWLTFDGARFHGQPPLNESGSWDITLDATDGIFTVSEGFALTILPANDAPFAFDDGPVEANSGQRTVIDAAQLLGNDSDPEGDAFGIVAAGGAAHGTLSVQSDGDVVYDADSGFVGNDVFTYTIADVHGATSTASVEVNVTDPHAGYQQGSDRSGVHFGSWRGDSAIDAGGGNDLLLTGNGDDLVDGGNGNDIILAGSGNDIIRGGAGRDLLFGGSGSDTFVYESGDGRDAIMDFTTGGSRRALRLGQDNIVLSVDGIEDFDSLLMHASQTRGGVVLDFGNGDELFLAGTRLASLDRDSFTFF